MVDIWLSSETSDRFAAEYAEEALDGPRWISVVRLVAATGAEPKTPIVSVSPDVGLPSEYPMVPSLGVVAW